MNDLQKTLDRIEDLPTLPDVVAKLNRLLSDPSSSAADINDVLAQDIALSAKILKLVNSPYYGFPRRITTITYAVVILGFNAVRNLALSAAVFDLFAGKPGKNDFDVKAFWRHSICTAIAGAAIARRCKMPDADNAFTAGLLHDIGKVATLRFFPEGMGKTMARVAAQDCLFLEAERAELSFDHATLGGALLERWNLPPGLSEAVRLHHAPAEARLSGRLTAAVHLADLLSRCLRNGSGGDRRIPRLDAAAWECLELGWPDVAAVADQIRAEIARAGAFFDLA